MTLPLVVEVFLEASKRVTVRGATTEALDTVYKARVPSANNLALKKQVVPVG